jgi:ketosteroid isomerase-like protein
MKSLREIAESYWAAECERDVAKVLSHYQPDAIFCPPGQTLKGHAEIATFYESSGRDFPGLKVRITNDFSVGDQATLEWIANLTSVSGEEFEIKGVNVIKVRYEKFEWVHAYFDPTVLQSKGD